MSIRDPLPEDDREAEDSGTVAVWTLGGFALVLVYILALILLKGSA